MVADCKTNYMKRAGLIAEEKNWIMLKTGHGLFNETQNLVNAKPKNTELLYVSNIFIVFLFVYLLHDLLKLILERDNISNKRYI